MPPTTTRVSIDTTIIGTIELCHENPVVAGRASCASHGPYRVGPNAGRPRADMVVVDEVRHADQERVRSS